MIGSCHIVFAYTILDLVKQIRVVMVFGDLYVLLGILDHLLGQIVEQTCEKMMGRDKPASWLSYSCELLHYSLDKNLLIFVELKGVTAINERAHLLADKHTGFTDIGS